MWLSPARFLPVAILCGLLAGCSSTPAGKPTLTVAAAANLTGVMEEIATGFEKQSRIHVTVNYGSTAQLAQQIENGAPFDVFASADTAHIDSLISEGKLRADSRAVYAWGQLVLWVPEGRPKVESLADLTRPEVRFVAVAQPDLAPYGSAAVEALKTAGVWEKVQPKVVYANNINQARQMGASGNADAAFTAYSLVMKEKGSVIRVDPKLYKPIEQALGINTAAAEKGAAQQFAAYMLGVSGRAILEKNGYLFP